MIFARETHLLYAIAVSNTIPRALICGNAAWKGMFDQRNMLVYTHNIHQNCSGNSKALVAIQICQKHRYYSQKLIRILSILWVYLHKLCQNI